MAAAHPEVLATSDIDEIRKQFNNTDVDYVFDNKYEPKTKLVLPKVEKMTRSSVSRVAVSSLVRPMTSSIGLGGSITGVAPLSSSSLTTASLSSTSVSSYGNYGSLSSIKLERPSSLTSTQTRASMISSSSSSSSSTSTTSNFLSARYAPLNSQYNSSVNNYGASTSSTQSISSATNFHNIQTKDETTQQNTISESETIIKDTGIERHSTNIGLESEELHLTHDQGGKSTLASVHATNNFSHEQEENLDVLESSHSNSASQLHKARIFSHVSISDDGNLSPRKRDDTVGSEVFDIVKDMSSCSSENVTIDDDGADYNLPANESAMTVEDAFISKASPISKPKSSQKAVIDMSYNNHASVIRSLALEEQYVALKKELQDAQEKYVSSGQELQVYEAAVVLQEAELQKKTEEEEILRLQLQLKTYDLLNCKSQVGVLEDLLGQLEYAKEVNEASKRDLDYRVHELSSQLTETHKINFDLRRRIDELEHMDLNAHKDGPETSLLRAELETYREKLSESENEKRKLIQAVQEKLDMEMKVKDSEENVRSLQNRIKSLELDISISKSKLQSSEGASLNTAKTTDTNNNNNSNITKTKSNDKSADNNSNVIPFIPSQVAGPAPLGHEPAIFMYNGSICESYKPKEVPSRAFYLASMALLQLIILALLLLCIYLYFFHGRNSVDPNHPIFKLLSRPRVRLTS